MGVQDELFGGLDVDWGTFRVEKNGLFDSVSRLTTVRDPKLRIYWVKSFIFGIIRISLIRNNRFFRFREFMKLDKGGGKPCLNYSVVRLSYLFEIGS